MKKTLVVLLMVLVSAGLFADFTWAQLNLYQGIGMAHGWADTYDDMYLEIEGGGRTGILNLYYFFDVNSIMGQGDYAVGGQGSFFTKINPRFSITKLMGKENCFGPIKESYLATQYKGYNGGASYYVGFGTDLAIPFFDMFSLNLYAMMQHIDDPDDAEKTMFEAAGYVVAINWFTKVYSFNDKFNLTYQGWSDFGFGNKYEEDKGAPSTADEFQMFNGFFWNYDKWSLSTSVKLHNHFMYSEANFGNHDATSIFIGLHRRF